MTVRCQEKEFIVSIGKIAEAERFCGSVKSLAASASPPRSARMGVARPVVPQRTPANIASMRWKTYAYCSAPFSFAAPAELIPPHRARSKRQGVGPFQRRAFFRPGQRISPASAKNAASRSSVALPPVSRRFSQRTRAGRCAPPSATLTRIARYYAPNLLSFFDDSRKNSRLVPPAESRVSKPQGRFA